MHVAFQHAAALMLGLPLTTLLLLWFVTTERRRGRPARQIAVMASFRSVVLLVLILLAARPVYVESDEDLQERNDVALLVDRSESMSLEQDGKTRYRQAVEFARGDLLPALKSAGLRVRPLLFAEDATAADGQQIARASPDGRQTNLARAILRAALETERPPLAVIALSDGVATESTDNGRAISTLIENRVPFVGIGIGGETSTQVLSLEGVTAPPAASLGQEFRLSARLSVTGEEELPSFDLVLLRDGQFAQKRTIAARRGAGLWQESFAVTEPAERFCRYTIQLMPPPGSALRCPNTAASVAVRIVGEKQLRVLFAQGRLTWDYKFIRLALSSDPTIRIAGLSRTASQSAFFQDVEDENELNGGFPTTIEQLAAYRVVVLSNLRPSELTPNQQELLARFCGEFGGGVLMIGGGDTFDASWQGSRLEQLLPVRFAPVGRESGTAPFRWQLADAAFDHPVFQIDDAGQHRAAWASLPEFTQCAAIDRVKSGAQVWAVRSNVAESDGPQVLMASQRYGAGISAVICVQNFWRWRLAQASNTHHFDRFWQQIFRYLGEAGRSAVALTLPDQPLQPNAEIRVLLERRADPRNSVSAQESYRLVIKDKAEKTIADQTVALRPGQSAEVTFRADDAGLFAASVLDGQGNVLASRSVEIKDTQREFAQTARNMETLRQWAAISDGVAVALEDCGDVRQLIDQVRGRIERSRQSSRQQTPVGVNGWILAVLVGLLSAEWSLRKRWGLLLLCFLLPAASAGQAARAQPADDRFASFFVGRVRYSQNDGNDCGDVGRSMAELVAQVSTIPVQNERRVTLSDGTLFETPFLFMNGHNDFTLSDGELENLRTYFEHGGFLFASGCCTNPGFPAAWRREFSRIFPNEKVQPLPYDHPIYRVFYRIERVRSLHRNQDVRLEAVLRQGRLVAVMCEDGLCCSFSMSNRCNVGRGVSPDDGRKLALNVAVYAMTH